jgi:hypothetical protein
MTFASCPHKSSIHLLSRFAIVLLLLLNSLPALADWPDGNHDKWVQFPDPRGFDILAAKPPAAESLLPLIIADDFECRTPGYITNIHIWASWLGENTTPNPGPIPPISITLSIWTDVPTNTANPFSHPGNLLWHETFFPGLFPGQYTVKVAGTTATETFLDPFPPPLGSPMGPDYTIYLYNFRPTEPFFQGGSDTSPTNYWLAVSAGTNTANFGWKTTATNNWNDDAVWGHVQFDGYSAIGDWLDLHDPRDPIKSLDMAFALTTGGTPPPPPPPVDKWHQLPDTNGFDVNATAQNIVADDFWCTNASVITNILVWGSWQNDAPFDGTIFVVSIWDNVAGGSIAGNRPFSRPGNRPIWSETFNPGDYTRTLAGRGPEHFYSPPSTVLTPENNIFLYSFVPKRPFCQKGGPLGSQPGPMTYWLSVQAILPSGIAPFGWKTSTNHWRDDAVYGHTAPGPTAVFDWKDLHDPSAANGRSLDMAFRLIHGPPTPDCDPHNRPKWAQRPDITPNGLDVLATFPKVLGDDFPCKVTGPISGIRVWGSWRGDLVDTNAVFQLGLWTDAPKDASFPYSRPGQLLCSNIFYPPTAIGTSLQRYNYSLAANNLQENFYDPEAPFPPFMGNDTQIWQYDFYPFQPSCWYQRGGDATFAGGLTYWLTVSYLATDPAKFFGWKTSTNHYQDDGVWGHMTPTYDFVRDWKDLHDPRSGISLDLSFALRSFPITGKNEDVVNNTPVAATGFQIVVSGIHEITWHYDDYHLPPWPNFQVTYGAGTTILTWSGKSVAVGGVTHIGWEMSGSGPPVIVSQNWLGPGGVVLSPPAYQLNYHYLGNATTGGAVLILNNNIVGLPMMLNNGSVEFFVDPPGLDQMNPQATGRNPIAKIPLALPTQPILPGGLMRIPMPPGVPNNAMYALFIMNLMDAQGQLQGMDFVLTPLDMALRPVIHGADLLPGSVNLRWFSLQDRTYHVQMTSALGPQPLPWSPVSLPDLIGDGDELNATVPLGQGQSYYRVVLDPQ